MTPRTDLPPRPGRRILVGGSSGSGKSTLARELAARLGLPCTEIDALFHGPGWTRLPTFESDVDTATRGDDWIVDSWGYQGVRDLLWARADTLVWLDYRRSVVMQRVVRRSFARATYDRELWNGNMEGFGDWLDPEHPVRWVWSTFTSRREETLARTFDPRWRHLCVVRLRSPRAPGPGWRRSRTYRSRTHDAPPTSAWVLVRRGLPDCRA